MSHLRIFHSVHTLTPTLGAAFRSESEGSSAKTFSTCSMLAAVLLVFGRRCCGVTDPCFSNFSLTLMKFRRVYLSFARPLILKCRRNSLLTFVGDGLRANSWTIKIFWSMVNILRLELILKETDNTKNLVTYKKSILKEKNDVSCIPIYTKLLCLISKRKRTE